MKEMKFEPLERAGRKMLFDSVKTDDIAKKYPAKGLTFAEWVDSLDWCAFKHIRQFDLYALDELLDFFSYELLETYRRLVK